MVIIYVEVMIMSKHMNLEDRNIIFKETLI